MRKQYSFKKEGNLTYVHVGGKEVAVLTTLATIAKIYKEKAMTK